jgi:hypothetical protein
MLGALKVNPRVGMDLPSDEIDRQLFNVASNITLGDGSKTLFFWHLAWLDGV